MTKPAPTTACAVLDRLEEATFSAPAHVVLREVRNGTGYARSARTADALVVSCWPSRGIWFAGLEVKVSRGDWLRELRDPEKSADIQKYCSYWWLAAPPGVVELAEVPERWGFVEVGAKARVLKQAPKLKAKALEPAFVASILRNRDKVERTIRARIEQEAKSKAEVEIVGTDVAALQRQLEEMTRSFERVTKACEAERQTRWTFEKAAGFKIDGWAAGEVGAAVALVRALQRDAGTFGVLDRLVRLGETAHGLVGELKRLAEPPAQSDTAELDAGEEAKSA